MDYKLDNNLLNLFRRKLDNISKESSILAIEGDTGFRKSFTINELIEYLSRNNDINYSKVDCIDIIGDTNVNFHRPLNIFKKAIEDLENGNTSSKKRFYTKLAVSISTMIPIIGDFTYTGKEIYKDIKEYQSSKKISFSNAEDDQIIQMINSLKNTTKNKPSVLFFDNFDRADQLSVKLVSRLAETIKSSEDKTIFNFIIVITYNRNLIKTKGYSLLELLKVNSDYNLFDEIKLKPFTKELINEISKEIPYYFEDEKFLDWFYKQTLGVPGDVIKYIDHFKSKSPFSTDKKLQADFAGTDFIPSTLQANFSRTLDNLSEEEKNILTTASAVGSEFSINLLKDLLNLDTLTLIRKLRVIFTKTNIIHSIGVFKQFGIKTTVYKFTQGYYQLYFKDLIEYEEKLNLNALIQAKYQQIYDFTTDEKIKKELAPLIAIHSKEAEDNRTAKQMFLITAQNAFKDGNEEIIELSKNQLIELDNQNPSADKTELSFIDSMIATLHDNTSNSSINNTQDNPDLSLSGFSVNGFGIDKGFIGLEFNDFRKSLIDMFINKEFIETAHKAENYYNQFEPQLNSSERIQLICIALNSFQAAGEGNNTFILRAEENINKNEIDELSYVILANTLSNFYYQNNQIIKAKTFLLSAAKKSLRLPMEFKLLTLSNIYRFKFFNDNLEEQKIKKAIDLFSKKLNYSNFIKNLGIKY